jgi:hypothetical protein
MSWDKANEFLGICKDCDHMPDPEKVKWALMASNLNACSDLLGSQIKDCAEVVCSLDGCVGGYGIDTRIHHVFEQEFLGSLYTVKNLEDLRGASNAWQVVKSIIDDGAFHNLAVELDFAFEHDGVMKNRIQNHELLQSEYAYWVTDTNPKDLEPNVYIQNLGLLHWTRIATGITAVVLQVNPKQAKAIRKPLWPDNGLTYFFDPAPSHATHGYTRNGSTGQPGYKEWVGLRKDLELTRIRAVYTPRILKFSWDEKGFCAGSWERIRSVKSDSEKGA